MAIQRYVIIEGGSRACGNQLYHVEDRKTGKPVGHPNEGLGMYYRAAKRLRDRLREAELMTDSVRETLYPNLIGCGDSADAADSTPAVVPEAPLARAIAYLGAVEVAPSGGQINDDYSITEHPARYALKATSPNVYLVLTAQALLDATAELRAEISPVQGPLLQHPGVVAMPAWWTPEQRYAVLRDDGACDSVFHSKRAAVKNARSYHRVVTADLTSGEEIPA